MSKIQGIKSVDFKIEASGSGVVNWNGSFKLFNKTAGKSVENHQLPKMRNVDPMRLNRLDDDILEKAQLIVSQNCFRHELFKNETSNLKSVNLDNVLDVLCSITGLIRGYVIADKVTKLSLKRKSCLLLEDLVDENTVLRYEQFANSGERNETSIYSKTNVDKTSYIAYGSIVIEDLQFIVLEDSFGRSAYHDILSVEEGKKVAEKMTEFLKSLDFDGNKNPEAVFLTNYVRKGSIMKNQGEAGLLLNENAIDLLVQAILEKIESVFLKQAKGYLTVDKLTIDYNAGHPMRIKRDETLIQNHKNEPYAVFYENIAITEEEFKKKNDETKKKKDELKKQKQKEEKEAEARKKAKEENKE
jgi:hypothetical protein